MEKTQPSASKSQERKEAATLLPDWKTSSGTRFSLRKDRLEATSTLLHSTIVIGLRFCFFLTRTLGAMSNFFWMIETSKGIKSSSSVFTSIATHVRLTQPSPRTYPSNPAISASNAFGSLAFDRDPNLRGSFFQPVSTSAVFVHGIRGTTATRSPG